MIRTTSAQNLGNRRTLFRVLVCSVVFGGAGFVAFLGAELLWFAHPQSVHANTVSARPVPGGSLVIVGGGKTPVPIRDRFVELAGGSHARIVVIPTASPSAERDMVTDDMAVWHTQKPEWVKFLHTRSRDEANSAAFVKSISEATGVWMGGGDQNRLTKVYLGTEVERQLMALLGRGGVIGGTSAGAAVMTRVMISRGRGAEATVGSGFDFLPGAVVDQHFLRRNRMKRLVSVLVDHPDLLGLGIDERTALEVHLRDNRVRVIGESYVFACVPDPDGHPTRLEILKPGDEVSLSGLKEPGNSAIVSAIDFKAL